MCRTVEEKILHVLVYFEDVVFSHGSHSFREQLFRSLLLDFWFLFVPLMSPLCILTSNFQTSVL